MLIYLLISVWSIQLSVEIVDTLLTRRFYCLMVGLGVRMGRECGSVKLFTVRWLWKPIYWISAHMLFISFYVTTQCSLRSNTI